MCARPLLLGGFVQLYDVYALLQTSRHTARFVPHKRDSSWALPPPVVLAAMLLAALLLVSEAFRPPTPRKRSLRLSARPQPTQQRCQEHRCEHNRWQQELLSLCGTNRAVSFATSVAVR